MDRKATPSPYLYKLVRQQISVYHLLGLKVQNPQAISVIYSKQGETGVVKKPFETKFLLTTLITLIVIEIDCPY